MPKEKGGGQTPLTEAQARALASWWGGRYQRLKPGRKGAEVLHGVRLESALANEAAPRKNEKIIICFMEEAGSLERCRQSDNPGAPDWVG